MAPRLSGQTSIFGVVFFVSKSLLGIEGQRKHEKFAILTRKPRSHARLLIYRTWPFAVLAAESCLFKTSQASLLDHLIAYTLNTSFTSVTQLPSHESSIPGDQIIST